MKKSFILPFVVLALAAGCEKSPAVEGGCPIGFGVAGTKAEINMPAGTFSVIGKRCAGSTWDALTAQDVFTGSIQNVTTDGTGACSYSPLQYWKANSAYRFRAVSPIAPDKVNWSDGLDGDATITNFTVNATASAQKDLLLSDVASASVGAAIGSPAPVALVFHHLLCNVHVQICEDTTEPLANPGSDVFTVTGVKLTGMPDKGTYTGTATSGSWNTGAAGSLSCVNNTSRTAPDSFDDSEIWENGLLLIPQTVSSSNAVSLVLDYQVSHAGGAASNKSVSIPIPDITWEAGKVYTYQLALSEESYIQFGNISVEPWGSTQASGSVIIK